MTTASHVRLLQPSFFHGFSSWSSAPRSSAQDFQKRPFLHTVSAVYFGKPITSTVSFSGPTVVAQDQATATVAFGFDSYMIKDGIAWYPTLCISFRVGLNTVLS